MKNCLTIAGSDCSGGAGIQADIKSFSANGTFGMSVIVSVVAENTSRVISAYDVPPQAIRDQLQAIFEDITVDGVKVGMLSDIETMLVVAQELKKYKPQYVVIDPVMIAKGGCALMKPQALSTLIQHIIPLAFLLTPNIPEAEAITGIEIASMEDVKKACVAIYKMGADNVLIKGGHLDGEPADVLYDGTQYYIYNGKRINTKNTHGTGCTLSSAITANLAKGYDVQQCVKMAKDYITKAIENALEIGNGHGPTNHFYEFYNQKGIK
ncbi:MAG TPA: bifunctional hydroxymethylpyrimidine kinase/phosphomethylpyrimidine kinase [Clostridiales bacterium]|nr:bifunctional hydroxymethylpyrimidine kinase/phosphomethylpyrimidine kinase [Clostridiales bacterium]